VWEERVHPVPLAQLQKKSLASWHCKKQYHPEASSCKAVSIHVLFLLFHFVILFFVWGIMEEKKCKQKIIYSSAFQLQTKRIHTANN
jgi:hypothetical protein